MHKNNPDDFDELKLHKLEYYAKLWRNDYPKVPIKRVLLYRYHSKYMKYIKKMKNPNSKGPRYVVVFEVTGLELELYQERHFHYSPDILESLPWKEFMDEMDNILKNTCRGKSIFIYGYDGFELVYNQPPDDDFYKEWTFIAVPPEGPLPESVYVDDDSCLWVLWDKNEPDNSMKKSADEQNKVFPCPAGTSWDKVRMALLPSEEKFMVNTPLGQGYYDHIDLGLFDGRTTACYASKLWRLLKAFAKMDGFIPTGSAGGKQLETIYSKAKRLNKRLQKTFGIKESIYSKRKKTRSPIGNGSEPCGYKTKFDIYEIPESSDVVMDKEHSLFETEESKYPHLKKSEGVHREILENERKIIRYKECFVPPDE